MRLESSILIKGNREKIFAIVQNVEKYSQFMPQFKEAKIYPINENKFMVERKTNVIMNIPFKWKSLVIIKKNESIKFEHIEGFLKGMKTDWLFEVVNSETKVTVTHELALKRPLLANPLVKRVLWNFFIRNMCYRMLEGLKKKIESEEVFEGK